MYQQILLHRWFRCNVNLLRWFTTPEKERQISPKKQWSLNTSIDNPLSLSPWTLIFRFDSHFLFAFLSPGVFLMLTESAKSLSPSLFTNHFDFPTEKGNSFSAKYYANQSFTVITIKYLMIKWKKRENFSLQQSHVNVTEKVSRNNIDFVISPTFFSFHSTFYIIII